MGDEKKSERGPNGSIIYFSIPVHKSFMFLMSILWTSILGLGLYLVHQHLRQMDSLQAKVWQLDQESASRSQKIDDIQYRVKRIEDKLDRIEGWVK